MNKAKEIQEIVEQSNRIVITSHRSPDGDSIGSSLGLYHLLKALGKTAVICHPDPCPAFITWAKGDIEILDFENHQDSVVKEMNSADLIFCLDYNGSGRLGREMGELLLQCSAKRIMIDHHLDPEDIFDIAVSEPNVCSTSQLIVELTESISEDLMNETIGTPLYLGIMTDTGSFRFSSVQPRTHEILAKLIRCGVKHSKIHEDTFDNNRLDRLKLRGYTIAEKLE
ncbi:MAG: DHH family phosphoesterase, partial [Crocinitomicaceae bacterium]|nr:DHH family phosphoesterase [Crocinitomicaceae bacterium]